MKYLIVVVLTIFFLTQETFTQSVHTSSNRAMKLYTEGMREYDFINFSNAENLFKAAISADGHFFEAYLMLGDLLTRQKRYSEAIPHYRAAVRIDSLFYKPIFFSLATAEIKTGDYSNALIHYRVYQVLSEKELI